MMPEELATFLREEVPRIQNKYDDWRWNHAEEPDAVADKVLDLLDALTAALALLRQCYDAMEHSGGPGWNPSGELEATLRLVVGEGESHHSIPGG